MMMTMNDDNTQYNIVCVCHDINVSGALCMEKIRSRHFPSSPSHMGQTCQDPVTSRNPKESAMKS